MKIEPYGKLPDYDAVYDIGTDLSREDTRILYLASLTDAVRKGADLSEEDVYS